MLPTNCFLQVCRYSLGLSGTEKSFGKINGSSSQHLSWLVLSKPSKSSLSAAGGLAEGRGHGFDVAITGHLTYGKKQSGKHPRFYASSPNRGDELKEEEGWHRNVFKPQKTVVS